MNHPRRNGSARGESNDLAPPIRREVERVNDDEPDSNTSGIESGHRERPAEPPRLPRNEAIVGGQAGANLGAALASAGDVNGDGFADIIVGAPGYDSHASPALHEGRSLVYLGSPLGPATIPVWTADGAHRIRERSRDGRRDNNVTLKRIAVKEPS
jgi:FG-GAP repeat